MATSTTIPHQPNFLPLIRSPLIWNCIPFKVGRIRRHVSPRAPKTRIRNRHLACRGLKASSKIALAEDAPVTTAEDVRAILFDMDGVLCNSEEISQR